MSVPASYVQRLNRAREEKGMSVDELARRSGYPADLVRPLLSGTPTVFSWDLNKVLCKALELDPHEMWPEREPTASMSRGTRTGG